VVPGAFDTLPYAAAAGCAGGLLLRYLLDWTQGVDLKERYARAVHLLGGGVSWRYGLLLLSLGHVLGFLFPLQILAWNGERWRLIVLEASGFLMGAWALLGVVGLLRRHLFDPEDRSSGSVLDFTLLVLLFVQIVSGLAVAGLYRWASSWAAVTLSPYLQSLVGLHPTPELVARLPYLVQLHAFLTVAVLVVVPGTHAVYFFLYPLHAALAFVLRPIERLVEATRPRLARWRRRTMAAANSWWDEED
jgi:nitrate reductase gamma subunit